MVLFVQTVSKVASLVPSASATLILQRQLNTSSLLASFDQISRRKVSLALLLALTDRTGQDSLE